VTGSWHSVSTTGSGWNGPPELCYSRLGARHLACFGLHSGTRLIGYVSLLFTRSRSDLDGLNALGTVGALWGTLIERLEAQATVRAREAMLRSVTDNGRDIVTILDAHGGITYQSASVSLLVGHTASEMLGQNVFGFMHPSDVPLVVAAFQEALRQPAAAPRVTYRFRHKDGQDVWLESTGRNLLDDPDVRGIVVHSRDVNDQHATQEALRRRVQELTALHAAGQALAGARTVEQVARTTIALVKERLRHEFVGVMRVRPDGSVEEVAYDDEFASSRTNPRVEICLPPGMGLIGACVAQDATLLVNDVHADPRYVSFHPGVRSELVVPLHVHGRVWGALNVESSVASAFNDEARQALETIAAQAGVTLANVLLMEELRNSRAELEAAYDRTIAGWARALDFRDHETEGHSQRVTDLTVQLARACGLTEDAIKHVRRGALLHDIGKMGVPDSVLLKPGPLTDEEWVVMRRHPVMAYEMLAPITFLQDALDIPYAHHERWDGAGYPRGLAGEEIPLAARVFAVVDVWDALRSDRPYRPAWSAERARAYIHEQAGRHFDARVVEAFTRMLDGQAAPQRTA